MNWLSRDWLVDCCGPRMQVDADPERRRITDRRSVPRGGRRSTDRDVIEREKRTQREQQVVRYLRKQDSK